MLAAKGLQIGGAVDIGDRGDVLVGIEHLPELAPGALHLGQTCHVRHRAAGVEVGQNHLLLGLGQDVGHFGHEMHAAEYDVLRLGLRRELGKFQRIAGKVGVGVDVGALIVVAEDDRALAEPRPRGKDTLLAGLVLQRFEAVESYRALLHLVSTEGVNMKVPNITTI